MKARAVLDELLKRDNIIFDASSYVWPEALSDFRPDWPVDKNGPVLESPLLERMTNNILQRIVHGGHNL